MSCVASVSGRLQVRTYPAVGKPLKGSVQQRVQVNRTQAWMTVNKSPRAEIYCCKRELLIFPPSWRSHLFLKRADSPKGVSTASSTPQSPDSGRKQSSLTTQIQDQHTTYI